MRKFEFIIALLLLFVPAFPQVYEITGIKTELSSDERAMIRREVDPFYVFKVDLSNFKPKGSCTMILKIDNYKWTLVLTRNYIGSGNAYFTDANGNMVRDTSACLTFNGYADYRENKVSLSTFGNTINGYIVQGSTSFIIASLPDFTMRPDSEQKLILYKNEDRKPEQFFFDLAPNPASDYIGITLDHESETSQQYGAQIISVADFRILSSLNLTGLKNRINIQNIPPGAYVLRLTFSHNTAQKTFIVQR